MCRLIIITVQEKCPLIFLAPNVVLKSILLKLNASTAKTYKGVKLIDRNICEDELALFSNIEHIWVEKGRVSSEGIIVEQDCALNNALDISFGFV